VGTGRIEAFSDGVMAVIITIMVLDFKVPHDPSSAALLALAPAIAVYAFSFVTVGILWINHHHALHAEKEATPVLLWSNLLLLFTMSLMPFATAYVTGDLGSPVPVAAYGTVLALTSVAFTLLVTVSVRQDADPALRRARFGNFQRKGFTAIVLYAVAIPLAFVNVPVAYAIFLMIPISYVLPERTFLEATERGDDRAH
jgi:uncharacterized membrane protein